MSNDLRHLRKMVYQQDMRWADMVTRAQMARHPAAKRAKAFLDSHAWLEFYNEALYGRSSTPNYILGRTNRDIYPAARRAGFPESSFLLPDIEIHKPVTHTSGVYVRDIIGAELEEFSQKVCLSFKQDGTMCAVVCVRDTETGEVLKFEREMNLRPAIDYVAKQLAAWHVQQHGEASVSGWTDFVKKAAGTVKRAATNKTVKSLYSQAKPFIKYTPVVGPYVDTSIDLATKAAKTYEKAKKGSKTAIAAVKKVKELANRGDQKAKFAVKVMKNVGALLKQRAQGITQPLLPQVAAQVPALRKQYGSLFKMGITAVSGNIDLVGNPIYDIIAGEDLELVGEELDIIGRRMSPMHRKMYAKARLKALKKARRQGKLKDTSTRRPPGMGRPARPALQEQYYPVPPGLAAKAVDMGPPNETTTPDLPSDEYYPEPEVEYDQVEDETVQGWLYNRPYRNSSTMLAQMQKSPGIAMAAREVYNRGMGRGSTSLDSLAAAAIKEF